MSDMGIKGIGSNIQTILDTKEITKKDDAGSSFSEMLKGSIEKVNTMQKEADLAVQDLLAGKDQNIHQVMIAVAKANLSFQLMMKVKNKIINAYEEVMRTQV